jgi:CRISPR/Cas system CSM-associated protein Csm4 (group 5 of RAMP superfamily)
MTKRFQDVYKQTNALIHGLGYVTYPKIFQLPLHSVDSSSWIQASQIYGAICYFDNGMKGVQYSDILKNKKKLPYQLQSLFERFEITPKMLLNIENSKGNKSIQSMLSIIAYLEYQKLSKRKDLNLFLAVSNNSQLNSILNINEMYNTDKLTYERFKNK